MTKEQKRFNDGLTTYQRLTRNVRRRLFYRDFLDALATNFLITGVVAFLFACATSYADKFPTTPAKFTLATIAIGLIATLTSIATARRERFASEKANDARYRLNDRCLTASGLLEETRERAASPIEELQLQDCFERVESARAIDVVAIKPRRVKERAALLLIIAILFVAVVWKPFAGQALANAPNETVLDVTREINENILPEIERLVKENPENDNLKRLDAKLKNLSAEIERYNDDPKRGTALVAQMEQEIQKAIAASGIEATDAALKELGAAMAGIETTRNIAQAFANGDYDVAADELEKLDFEKMSARDRQALAEKLKAAAEIIRSRKDEQTAQLTEQLAEELQAGKCSSCKNTACKLAGKARAQKKNKETAKQLDCQMARLGLCKSNCAGACATCEQNCPSSGTQQANNNAGKNASAGQAQKGGSDAKSLESSALASDPLAGKDEKLDSTRNLTKISGKENEEGDSTAERVQSSEAVAVEAVRERDLDEREYAKQIEAALDADDIPIERRQVARDYFEKLRDAQRDQRQK